MRQAPPIALTLSGGGAWRVAQVALPALSAALVVTWLAPWSPIPASPLLVVPVSALLAAVACWWGSAPQSVHLQWNGERWAADGSAGEVDLMLDLGPWMLLRFRPPGARSRWLPVPRREAGASEQGLRVALYSRGPDAVQRQA